MPNLLALLRIEILDSLAVLFSILISAPILLLAFVDPDHAAERWARRRLGPELKQRTGVLLRRAERLSSRPYVLDQIHRAVAFSCLVTVELIAMAMGNWQFVVMFFFVSLAGFVVGIALVAARSEETGSRFGLSMAMLAARQVAHHAPLESAMAFLAKLSREHTLDQRAAAAYGYSFLPKEQSTPELERIVATDESALVRIMARQGIAELESAAATAATLGTGGLRRIVEGFVRASNDFRNQVGGRVQMLAKLVEMRKRIDKLVSGRFSLVKGHPHVLCRKCLSRTRVVAIEDWKWLECRLCGEDLDLARGVETVVGVIGEGSDWNLKGGLLQLKIWDQALKKAIPADVDRIELVKGMDEGYDWAVSAVITTLTNGGRIPQDGIPVSVAADVTLEANSQALLHMISKKSRSK